jgi:hypothetical protein
MLRLVKKTVGGLCKHPVRVGNENGFILITSLVILTLITFMGIYALNTTTMEMLVAANDSWYKQAFLNADTGISFAAQGGVISFPMLGPSPSYAPVVPQPDELRRPVSPGGTVFATLQYIDNQVDGNNVRHIEVRSTGLTSGGAQAVVIAGISGIMPGGQTGAGNPTGYP